MCVHVSVCAFSDESSHNFFMMLLYYITIEKINGILITHKSQVFR